MHDDLCKHLGIDSSTGHQIDVYIYQCVSVHPILVLITYARSEIEYDPGSLDSPFVVLSLEV